MASRAQWRFEIFAVGLQMAIKLNQVKDAVQVRLHFTFSDTQLCGRCLINMTPVVKVVIHCVVALL